MNLNEPNKDLIWAFEFEHGLTKNYFDLMYRSLQFTFAAIIAVLVVAYQKDIESGAASLFLTLVLPVCTYVFGVLYAFNAYALAVSGKRAEIVRIHIFPNKSSFTLMHKYNDEALIKVLFTYVGNKRTISLISYGVALGCFLLAPLTSIILGCTLFIPYSTILGILSITGLITYYLMMSVIIVGISKNYFQTDTIQETRKNIISCEK